MRLGERHFAGEVSGYAFTDAALLPNGCEVVNLKLVGSETQPAILADGSEGESQSSEDEYTDWSAVEEGERGTLPEQLVFVFYPRKNSEEMFRTYFRNLPHRSARDLEGEGGTVIVESGDLNWRGFSTNYVRQREFMKRAGEPNFVDTLRVNLSLGQSCVMVAIWPAGMPGSEGAVEALLAPVESLKTSN